MTDPLTAALRTLHAAGVIRSWVRPGMRLVDDDKARRSYMVVMREDGGLWLCDDSSYPDPMDPEWCDGQESSALRIADDSVTTAALLPIVREARGDATLSTRCRCTVRDDGAGWSDGPWDIVSTSEHVTISVHGTLAPTERDALTAALVARAALVEVPVAAPAEAPAWRVDADAAVALLVRAGFHNASHDDDGAVTYLHVGDNLVVDSVLVWRACDPSIEIAYRDGRTRTECARIVIRDAVERGEAPDMDAARALVEVPA